MFHGLLCQFVPFSLYSTNSFDFLHHRWEHVQTSNYSLTLKPHDRDWETIRQVINNTNNSLAPTLFKSDGTSYQGSTYAINRLSKPYKESIDFNNSIHGGINYNKGKDRDFVYSATHIHGPVSTQSPKGIPQNVMVVGVGEGQGTDAFINCKDIEDPNEKRKWRFSAVLGRFAQTSDHLDRDWETTITF